MLVSKVTNVSLKLKLLYNYSAVVDFNRRWILDKQKITTKIRSS